MYLRISKLCTFLLCHTLWFVILIHIEFVRSFSVESEIFQKTQTLFLQRSRYAGDIYIVGVQFRQARVIFRLCTILFFSREVVILGTFTLWEYSSDTQGSIPVLQPQGWTRSVHQLHCQSEVSQYSFHRISRQFIIINLNGKTLDIDIIKG